jgi:hypothetical protein
VNHGAHAGAALDLLDLAEHSAVAPSMMLRSSSSMHLAGDAITALMRASGARSHLMPSCINESTSRRAALIAHAGTIGGDHYKVNSSRCNNFHNAAATPRAKGVTRNQRATKMIRFVHFVLKFEKMLYPGTCENLLL